MQNRNFKGIWIPAEIWLSKELTMQEKLFIVEIESLDNEDGCYASNAYFADFFDLSKNRCSEVISSLIKKEYVTYQAILKEGTKMVEKRILRVNKEKLYSLNLEHTPSESRHPPSTSRQRYSTSRQRYSESRQTPSENWEGNNTFNNTFNINSSSSSAPLPSINPFNFYQENLGLISPFISQTISYEIDEVGEELVLEAMKKAVAANKPNLKYAQGIIRKWKSRNVKTLEDVQALENEFARQQDTKNRKGKVRTKTPEEQERIEQEREEYRLRAQAYLEEARARNGDISDEDLPF